MSGKTPRTSIQPSPVTEPGLPEAHYTIHAIAEQWNLSYDKVRRLFLNEPGVLKIGEGSRLLRGRHQAYKRRYFVLRVPHSVLHRVQQRLVNKRDNGMVGLPDSHDTALHAS
jgi:hypothetical protein